MFSKLQIIAFMVVVALIACSDKEPTDTKEQFTNVRLLNIIECLTTYSDKVDVYFKGKLETPAIRKFWSCHTDILQMYIERTPKTGSNPRYSYKEVLSFLNEILSGRLTIEEELITAIFKVKKILIGGSDLYLTRDELFDLQKKIELISDLTVSIKEEVPTVVKFYESPKLVGYTELKRSWDVVSPEVIQLILRANFREISFLDLRQIFELYLDQETHPDRASTLTNLVKSFTRLTVGPEAKITDQKSLISYINLSKLMSFSFVGWDLWLAGKHNDHMFALIIKIVNSIQETLQSQHQFNESVTIDDREWLTIVENLAVFLGAQKMQKEKVQDSVAVFKKVLFETKSGEVTLDQVKTFNEKLQGYRLSFNNYDQLKSSSPECKAKNLNQRDYKKINSHTIFCHLVSYQLLEKNKMALSPGKEPISASTYYAINIQMVALNLVLQVYTETIGLTKEQVITITGDVKKLISPFVILDDSLFGDIVQRLTIEADLFTPYSDGDGNVSLFEVTSYLAMVLSSYSSYMDMVSFSQCAKSTSDACYMDVFDQYRSHFLEPFAEFNKYLDAMDLMAKKDYYKSFRAILLGSPDASLQFSDFFQVMVLLHYQEVFFTAFNKNKNAVLDYDEVQASYTHYRDLFYGLLDSVFPDLNEQTALGYFSFLVSKGKLVDTSNEDQIDNINDAIELKHWLSFPQKRSSKAERKELMNVIEFISQLF